MSREDYAKYYIQGSDHYLIPKDVFIELFEEMSNWKEEAKELKEELDYLRSGEYLNQLRFERDMLQHVVDNSKVSKVDKEFIDMTHRNTELLEENQVLKKQLDKMKQIQCNFLGTGCKRKIEEYEVQQKEFIEYLEDMLVSELDIFTVVRVCDVLSKYKEIIGNNEQD